MVMWVVLETIGNILLMQFVNLDLVLEQATAFTFVSYLVQIY